MSSLFAININHFTRQPLQMVAPSVYIRGFQSWMRSVQLNEQDGYLVVCSLMRNGSTPEKKLDCDIID